MPCYSFSASLMNQKPYWVNMLTSSSGTYSERAWRCWPIWPICNTIRDNAVVKLWGQIHKPNSGQRHKTHQTQSMAAWATTRMRKVYISQNTQIVAQKNNTLHQKLTYQEFVIVQMTLSTRIWEYIHNQKMHISHSCVGWWLGVDQAPSHHPNQQYFGRSWVNRNEILVYLSC